MRASQCNHITFCTTANSPTDMRSEEHTSELQSQSNLVCRLLLEKKKKSRELDIPLTHLHLFGSILPLNPPSLFLLQERAFTVSRPTVQHHSPATSSRRQLDALVVAHVHYTALGIHYGRVDTDR